MLVFVLFCFVFGFSFGLFLGGLGFFFRLDWVELLGVVVCALPCFAVLRLVGLRCELVVGSIPEVYFLRTSFLPSSPSFLFARPFKTSATQ